MYEFLQAIQKQVEEIEDTTDTGIFYCLLFLMFEYSFKYIKSVDSFSLILVKSNDKLESPRVSILLRKVLVKLGGGWRSRKDGGLFPILDLPLVSERPYFSCNCQVKHYFICVNEGEMSAYFSYLISSQQNFQETSSYDNISVTKLILSQTVAVPIVEEEPAKKRRRTLSFTESTSNIIAGFNIARLCHK